jgi:hypothetical protein
MATVRECNNGVLLVADVQVGPMGEAWNSARITENVARSGAHVQLVWPLSGSSTLTKGSLTAVRSGSGCRS